MKKVNEFLRSVLLVSLILCISSVGVAGLFSTPIDNHSFETDDISVDGYAETITGWYTKNFAGQVLTDDNVYAHADGGTVGYMYGDGGGIYQQIGTYDPDQSYTVSLWIGGEWGPHWGTAGPEWYDADNNIEIWAGGDLGLVDNGVLPSDIGAVLLDGAYDVGENTAGGYVDVTLNTGTLATAGDTLWLVLSTNATEHTKLVDNVSVVPEPATMVLLGLGGLVLRCKRRRA